MDLPRDPAFLLQGTTSSTYSWRSLLYLLVILFASLLLAAILSPPIFWGISEWATAAPNPLNTYLAEKSFPRYFDRLRWLAVLLALPWLIRRCGLWSLGALGLAPTERAWREFIRWAGLGLTLLLVIVAVQFSLGVIHSINAMAGLELAILIFSGLLSGLLVGFLEEVVFRGVIFRIFYTALRPLPAAVFSSLLFASLHFKKIPTSIWPEDSPVTTTSGLEVAFWTLFSVAQTFDLQRFLTLFLVGFVLTIVFVRERSLWACWGMHAAWVWLLTVNPALYQVSDTAGTSFFGTQRLVDGWLTPSLLLVIALSLYLSQRVPIPPSKGSTYESAG